MREQVIIGLKPRGESPHLVQVYVAEDDFWLLGARLSRVDSPIQFYGDDFGADACLCHPSKEGIGGLPLSEDRLSLREAARRMIGKMP